MAGEKVNRTLVETARSPITVGMIGVQQRLFGRMLVIIERTTALREQTLALLSAYRFMTSTRLKAEPINTEKTNSTGVMYLKA
jgi:hypothetical protein